LTIIDCQPNVHNYIRAHIPGAVYLAEESLRISREGFPHRWIDAELASLFFSKVGVKEDVPVVVYTSTNPTAPTGDGVPQGMIAYSLIRYGHPEVMILDGGFDRWVSDNRPLSTQYPKSKVEDFQASTSSELPIDYEEFLRVKDAEGVVHIDSRQREQYVGESAWPKRGHIPGAINIPWSEAFRPDNLCQLRTREEVLDTFISKGVTEDKEVICHCGSGRKAAAQLCVLRWYLGYPHVRLFEGSFTEWCAHGDNATKPSDAP